MSQCAQRISRLTFRSGVNLPGSKFRPRSIVAAVIAAALLLVIWNARYVLLLLFAGCIGALLLYEIVARLQKWFHIRRRILFGAVLLFIGTSAALGGWLRGSAILQQIHELRLDIPAAAHRVAFLMASREWSRWIAVQVLDPDRVSSGIDIALAGLGGAITTTASILGGIFVIGFVTVYLAAEPDRYERGLLRITPAVFQGTLQACIDRAIQNLRCWIAAKALSMCAIGALVTTGLWWLHIPLGGTLGAFAALMTFIPNFGPLISVLPAALLAFAISPAKGIMTILLFGAAHFLEGNLVTPLAERRIVKLPPVLTIATQLILATLVGIAGVAVAAPLAAVMLGIVQVLAPSKGETSNQLLTSCKSSDTAVQA